MHRFDRLRSSLFSFLPFAVILAAAMILRLTYLPDTILFHDDQGLDMLMVREMEQFGYRPLVGPYLSVARVFTPPTYYYLTWALYRLTHTIPGVVYGYAFINLAGLIVLMLLVRDMAGRRAAAVTGGLYAVSSLMIEHSRTFWQPYSLQLFLLLFLLLQWHAFRKKSLPLLLLGLMSFQIALTVYPSPMLLVPYVLYQLVRWFREAKSLKVFPAVSHAFITFAGMFMVAFFPQTVYEIVHRFPTLQTYLSFPYTSVPIQHLLAKLGQNIGWLGLSFVPVEWQFRGFGNYLVVAFFLFCAVLFLGLHVPPRIRAFIAPLPLASGLGMFLFQTKDVYRHHGWAFLPFLFLLTGYAVDRALGGSKIQRVLAVFILLIYAVLNTAHAQKYFSVYTTDNIKQIQDVSEFIGLDMALRGINEQNTAFYHTIPEAEGYAKDEIFRIFYWLVDSGRITMPLTPEGNNFTFRRTEKTDLPNLYVICVRYPEVGEAMAYCAGKITKPERLTLVTSKKIGNMLVLALTR